MKMNGSGCWFVELTLVTNHAWAPVLNSIDATHGRMLTLMDLGEWYCIRISLHVSLCCIQRCNLYCMPPILRPGPFHVSYFNGEKKENEQCLKCDNTMQFYHLVAGWVYLDIWVLDCIEDSWIPWIYNPTLYYYHLTFEHLEWININSMNLWRLHWREPGLYLSEHSSYSSHVWISNCALISYYILSYYSKPCLRFLISLHFNLLPTHLTCFSCWKMMHNVQNTNKSPAMLITLLIKDDYLHLILIFSHFHIDVFWRPLRYCLSSLWFFTIRAFQQFYGHNLGSRWNTSSSVAG